MYGYKKSLVFFTYANIGICTLFVRICTQMPACVMHVNLPAGSKNKMSISNSGDIFVKNEIKINRIKCSNQLLLIDWELSAIANGLHFWRYSPSIFFLLKKKRSTWKIFLHYWKKLSLRGLFVYMTCKSYILKRNIYISIFGWGNFFPLQILMLHTGPLVKEK